MKSIIFALVIFFTTAGVAGDSIHGVLVEGDQPMPHREIELGDAYGNQWVTTTDEEGQFEFLQLAEGWYAISVVDPWNHWAEQFNSTFNLYLENDVEVTVTPDMTDTSTGVSVDFGSPSGGKSFQGSVAGLALMSNQFQLSMFLDVSTLDEMPDTVEVNGHWYIPGQGDLDLQIVGAELAGTYTGTLSQVTYENNKNDRVSFVLSRAEWPHLNLSGESALVQFEVSDLGLQYLQAAGGRVSFHFTYSFYKSGQLIATKAANWDGYLN